MKHEYEKYLDYMYKHEELYGFYPPHLCDGQWMPLSYEEFVQRTKNGTELFNLNL